MPQESGSMSAGSGSADPAAGVPAATGVPDRRQDRRAAAEGPYGEEQVSSGRSPWLLMHDTACPSSPVGTAW